jgi:hypothetical protein
VVTDMKHAQDRSSHEGNNGGHSADRGKEVIPLTKHGRSNPKHEFRLKILRGLLFALPFLSPDPARVK